MDYLDYTYLAHHGIKGQRWGVRRYQNIDGTLTEAGKSRRSKLYSSNEKLQSKIARETGRISSAYKKMPSHYLTDIGKSRQEKAIRKVAVSNKKIDKYNSEIAKNNKQLDNLKTDFDRKYDRAYEHLSDPRHAQTIDKLIDLEDAWYKKYDVWYNNRDPAKKERLKKEKNAAEDQVRALRKPLFESYAAENSSDAVLKSINEAKKNNWNIDWVNDKNGTTKEYNDVVVAFDYAYDDIINSTRENRNKKKK